MVLSAAALLLSACGREGTSLRHAGSVERQDIEWLARPTLRPAPLATPKTTPPAPITLLREPSAQRAPRPEPGGVVAQVRKAWPGDAASEESLLRIIGKCENRTFNPKLVSATDDWGVAQINRPTWRRTFEAKFGPWVPNIYDVTKNIKMAWIIYVRAGHSWQPWSCRRFA